MVSPRVRTDLATGLAWFMGMYVYDAVTSYYYIRRALGKVTHDPSVREVVVGGVSVELIRMLGAYALMGALGGLVLHVFLRAVAAQRLWPWRFGFIASVIAWMSLRGAVLWPRMYLGAPGAEWLANHGDPRWFDAGMLSLAILVGLVRLVQSRVSWVPLASLPLLGLLALNLDWHPPAGTAPKNQGPNVLIVGFDALRPDHLQHFGYHRDTTPHLDDFLAKATVFPATFTPLARTWPAWSSILTGADPLFHGKRDSLPAVGAERPDVPMITDILGEAGVHSTFLTDDSRFSYMLPEHNFDVVDQPPVGIGTFAISRDQPFFRAFATFLHGPLGWWMVPAYRYNQAMGTTHRHDYFAERVADAIADAAEQERFFISAHFCLLHAPGDRPWPYHQMYGMTEVQTENRFRYRSTGSTLADAGSTPDPDKLERLERASTQQNIDIYDAGLAMVDESWVRIEQALTDAGLWDNTLVIVLSDHGEDFLEEDTRYKFRGPNHGFHPWGTGQNQVLLAAHIPGQEPGVRQDLRGLVDIAPTVAEFLDVPFEAPTGISLLHQVPEDRVLFGETGVSEAGYWSKGHKRYSFRRAHHRYTVDPNTKRVYQRPQYDRETILAKDRWVIQGDFVLVEENVVPGPRYSLFNWKLDPTYGTDLSMNHIDLFANLKTQLSNRPYLLEPTTDDGVATP